MSLEVVSIGSSSSGNSYLIKADNTNILLDVGLTAKKIMAALAAYDVCPEDVNAVLLTHEHVDHVKSVRAIGRKCSNSVFITSRGTAENTANFCYIPEERRQIICAGTEVTVGAGGDAVDIQAFSLSHDAAEPIGFTIKTHDHKLAVVTDTGIITDEIFDAMRGCDMLVFEANHDEDLLMFGEYPYHVKVRIKSDHGHLSNRYAGEILAKLLDERPAEQEGDDPERETLHIEHLNEEDHEIRRRRSPLNVMLAHLSFNNNAPFCARTTIEEILNERGYERDADYILTIASRDEMTAI